MLEAVDRVGRRAPLEGQLGSDLLAESPLAARPRGRLIGRRMDARWLIGAGLLLMTAGNYWMSQLNLDIGPGQAV